MRRLRAFPLITAVSLAASLLASAPAHSTGDPRLGDPSSDFDAALGPAIPGQTWWFYPLPDGSLARGASTHSSLEFVAHVLFLQRNWNDGYCASPSEVDATRRQYLPADARKQWNSSFADGGGSPAATQIEGWHSDSLAEKLAGSGLYDPGSIVVTSVYGFGDNCSGTIRLTFDGARTGWTGDDYVG